MTNQDLTETLTKMKTSGDLISEAISEIRIHGNTVPILLALETAAKLTAQAGLNIAVAYHDKK